MQSTVHQNPPNAKEQQIQISFTMAEEAEEWGNTVEMKQSE